MIVSLSKWLRISNFFLFTCPKSRKRIPIWSSIYAQKYCLNKANYYTIKPRKLKFHLKEEEQWGKGLGTMKVQVCFHYGPPGLKEPYFKNTGAWRHWFTSLGTCHLDEMVPLQFKAVVDTNKEDSRNDILEELF